MNANRYFSFSRLALVMKRDFMENWKTNLYRFLGAYCGFLILMFIGYLSADSFISFSELVYRGYASVLIIGGFFWASIIMEPMNTQQNRASFLMLPASSLEKFIARTLYVTLGFFGLMTAGLLMAEVSLTGRLLSVNTSLNMATIDRDGNHEVCWRRGRRILSDLYSC